MWFTNRECQPENEMWYWFIALVVVVGNVSIIMRQLLGVEEATMIIIIIGTFLSVGFLFILITYIIKVYSGGCFLINEWWLLLTVAMYPISLAINELTYEIASPLSMFPFFFMYPAIAIKAKDEEAAIAAIIGVAIMTAIVLVTYFITQTSGWWYYGIVFQNAPFWERVYRFTIGGIYLSGTTAAFIALLPIGLGDFYLPGYYVWRYRKTAIVAIVIYAIIIYMFVYGGVLRTITNVAYRGYAVV